MGRAAGENSAPRSFQRRSNPMTDTVVPFPKPQCAIVSYFHCRCCIAEKKHPNIAAGITHDGRLQVWCETHDAALGTFVLALPPVDLVTCGLCEHPDASYFQTSASARDCRQCPLAQGGACILPRGEP